MPINRTPILIYEKIKTNMAKSKGILKQDVNLRMIVASLFSTILISAVAEIGSTNNVSSQQRAHAQEFFTQAEVCNDGTDNNNDGVMDEEPCEITNLQMNNSNIENQTTSEGCTPGYGYNISDPNPVCKPLIEGEKQDDMVVCMALGCPGNPPDANK